MPFTAKVGGYSGRIHPVTVGTGENAIVLGGNNVLPFYSFDGAVDHPPKIGVEISDAAGSWDWPGLVDFYAGCTTMAQRAVRAAALENADFLCLRFERADPNGEDRSVEDCVADAVCAADAVTKPLVILGCDSMEKDGKLFAALAEALRGKNVLIMSAKSEDYKAVGAAVALACGQKLGAQTADDINLAKQLNIMLKALNVDPGAIVMDIGTTAVGYGFEYAASTLDRVRLAALAQGDTDLQMPILAAVSTDTWTVKESTATEADESAWGDREERAISMEIATAAADLTGGADAVVLRHPASVAAIGAFIQSLV